tara:strand:+ start:1507 stop:2580 length:1074 start_codon:yes stop_codon:yes gene_type:complete
MLNKITVKKVKKNYLKKINQFHNNFYKSKRSIKQFLWQFKVLKKDNQIKNYFYASKRKKIIGTLAFVKYEFISNKKKIDAYKPEDLLMNVEAIKIRLFEKINYLFENKNKKIFFFHFSDSAWAFKKLDYKTNFGNYFYFIKFYEFNDIYKILLNKSIPKFIAKIISHILSATTKFFFTKKAKQRNKKLVFVNYTHPPIWSDHFIIKFVNHWKCITLNRSKNFLNWRVFNNPYVKNKFIAFYYKNNPVGYIIYNVKNYNLSVVDLILIPLNKEINSKLILNEVLSFLDNYSIKNKIKTCKFELYLNSKLNKIIYFELFKNGYFKKRKVSDFSYKSTKNKINSKTINSAYITNINKSGK